MIRNIATAAVYVEDQARALLYWTRQVGFEVHREMPMGPHASWIEVGPRGGESCLVLYPKSMMEDWAERKPLSSCEDVQETYREMRHRGVPFSQEPRNMPWGPFAIFIDPEGNSFGPRGRSQAR